MQPLFIIGTGGNALDFLDVVEAINCDCPTWQVEGFLDDARPKGATYHGFPIVGPVSQAGHLRKAWFVCAVGSDHSFRRRFEILEKTGLSDGSFATIVHPGACVSSRASLGPGTIVNFGVSVGGEVTIGRHVILGPGSVIGHNTIVEDLAIVAPRAVISGAVRLGRECYIGAGASVKQKLTVGQSSLVGLGAVVVGDVAPGTTVVGNPARPLNQIKSIRVGA